MRRTLIPLAFDGLLPIALGASAEVGSFNPSGYALDIWVEGRYAYIILGYFGLLPRGSYLYVTDREEGLRIIKPVP